jgi:hypothetical protein
MKSEWRSTAAIRNFRYKRRYYDRCGNLKLVVSGTGQQGCWRNSIDILTKTRKNEDLDCEKEKFNYLTQEELEEDLKTINFGFLYNNIDFYCQSIISLQ